jgi:L-iditol 2-dehydrogenase
MKAFQLTGLRALELRDVPDPRITRPTDVMIRLGAVGVCGSDVHYYSTGRIGCQIVDYPFTVGHECAGTVVAVGDEVTEVQVGTRVAIEPAIHCGHCDQCRSHRENTCRELRFLGCPGQMPGSLSEYLVMPQGNCIPISDDLSLSEATISEPLAIGIYAWRRAGMKRASRIGILGAGPIGRSVLLSAVQAGCQAVYVTDLIDMRCVAAAIAGATWIGSPRRHDVVADILAREPLGLDAVFECCGQQEALDQAVALLRPGGTLLIIGIPEIDSIRFNPDELRRKEITIVNVRRQRDCVRSALQLIEGCREEVHAWITHRFPFAETDAAFDLVANYRAGVLKAMIEFE